jgi:hypothetical protein
MTDPIPTGQAGIVTGLEDKILPHRIDLGHIGQRGTTGKIPSPAPIQYTFKFSINIWPSVAPQTQQLDPRCTLYKLSCIQEGKTHSLELHKTSIGAASVYLYAF